MTATTRSTMVQIFGGTGGNGAAAAERAHDFPPRLNMGLAN